MLVIRKEQNEALRNTMASAFEQKAMADLRKRFPRKTIRLSESELLGLVRRGSKRARSFHIETGYDIMRFLEHLVESGEDFGQSPETSWAKEILLNRTLSGRRKMDRILQHETFARR